MNDTITDSRLEEMMLHEAACQMHHYVDPRFPCTFEVTHRYRVACLGIDKVTCSAIVARQDFYVAKNASCAFCLSAVADCWSVVPV